MMMAMSSKYLKHVILITTSVCYVASNELLQALDNAGIPRDLGLDVSANLRTIHVNFDGLNISAGQTFSKDQVGNEPTIALPDSLSPDSLFTFLMVDPDAPSRKDPIRRSWLHWLVVNIKGSQFDTGEVKCPFNPSSPPKDSGFHRYVFVVFKQPEIIADVKECDFRGSYNISEFASTHNLGEVLASNFYEARNEPLD